MSPPLEHLVWSVRCVSLQFSCKDQVCSGTAFPCDNSSISKVSEAIVDFLIKTLATVTHVLYVTKAHKKIKWPNHTSIWGQFGNGLTYALPCFIKNFTKIFKINCHICQCSNSTFSSIKVFTAVHWGVKTVIKELITKRSSPLLETLFSLVNPSQLHLGWLSHEEIIFLSFLIFISTYVLKCLM